MKVAAEALEGGSRTPASAPWGSARRGTGAQSGQAAVGGGQAQGLPTEELWSRSGISEAREGWLNSTIEFSC